jgi:hypothetical protein
MGDTEGSLLAFLIQWELSRLDARSHLACPPELVPPTPLGGSRARYVDVLNPSGTPRNEPALAPADLFAPLAPLPIPSNLFVPTPGRQHVCVQGHDCPLLMTSLRL